MGRYVTVLLLCCFFLFSTTAVFARQLVIFKSHDYVSRSYEVQKFQDTLGLQSGQLSLPLTMTIYNGSLESPSFKWFRIIVNGQLIASESDLKGKEVGSKDVTGLFGGADLQVQVEAGGVPGANLWWTLTAPQMELSYAEPQQVTMGQSLKLIGSNFPTDPKMLAVTLNGREVPVLSASSNNIIVQVPANAEPGVNQAQVRTVSDKTNPISVTVLSRPVPEILGIDCWMAPPGGTINISGRNFSPNSGDNKVFFGDVPGQVNSSSTTQITVIVPNWQYGPSQINIPVSVEANGVRSANTFPFDIGPSYHGAIPQFGHD